MSGFTNCNNCKMNGRTYCEGCAQNYPDLFTPKPKQKVIKLDEMIGTDIDMEFTNLNDFEIQPYHTDIGFLTGFDNSTYKMYSIKNGVVKYYKSRIRQDHPHANIWLKCPLPEGLKVNVYYNDGGASGIITKYLDINWQDVNRFYVYGPADGWKYEWGKKE